MEPITDPDPFAAFFATPPRGDSHPRGRPKLGVISREVTLLPHPWAWLNAQPGGASATLRRLVDLLLRSAPGSARGPEAATQIAETAAHATNPQGATDPHGVAQASAGVPRAHRGPEALRRVVEAALGDSLGGCNGATLDAIGEAVVFAAPGLSRPAAIFRVTVGSTLYLALCDDPATLPEPVLRRYEGFMRELSSCYPRDDRERVSSHNALTPDSVRFVNARPWFLNWQSSGAADPYVDLAAVANFFALHPDLEEFVLEIYFGRGFDVVRRSRLFLMQQANRVGLALALLNRVASSHPGTRITGAQIREVGAPVRMFYDLCDDLEALRSWEGQLHIACVLLDEALFHCESGRFADSVFTLWTRRQAGDHAGR